jgi:hypothetical protein
MGALQPTLAEAAAAAELIQERRRQNLDLAITRSEAEALLVLDRLQPDMSASWRDYIAGAIAGYLSSVAPTNILTEEKSAWLFAAVAPNGRVETVAAFETLIRAMEMARETPVSVVSFVLSQLKAAIINGEGPAIGSRPHFSRTIDAEDTALLYRILIAAGGIAGTPVSRAEANALFDLHDAVARSKNDSGFDDLFSRAIEHHVLAVSGVAVKPRSVALASQQRKEFIQRPHAEHTAWLSERIMRDGRPTAAEFELLRLIGAEPVKRNASLRGLLDSTA